MKTINIYISYKSKDPHLELIQLVKDKLTHTWLRYNQGFKSTNYQSKW